jgi:hypothetical protein
MSASTFTSLYLNPALLSTFTNNWGPSAPANGPGGAAAFGQWWLNTSGSPTDVLSIYDGTSWVAIGSLDISAHTFSIPVANGGTGNSSYTVGDLLYASGATTLAKLPDVASGQPLISGGVATPPLYAGSWARFLPASTRLTLSRNATTWVAAGTTSLHIAGADNGEARIEWTAANSDSVAVFGRLNNTFASPQPLAANDQVMGLIGVGIDTAGSTTMQQGGAIGGFASQAWTSTHHGYYFTFYGINDNTIDLVNFGTFKNQKAGFGNESNPQYGLVYSANAATGIADPFGNVGLGLIGADSGGPISANLQGFASNPVVNIFRANNTIGSKTALSSGNIIGGFFGFGYAGATSSYNGGAGIQMVANQAFSTGNAGTRLEVLTTADASVSSSPKFAFFGSGGFSVGSVVDPTNGVVTAGVGFRVANAAPSGNLLLGDGTNFISSAFPAVTSVYREKLTANRTYYVRTDGSNSNNGLANTAGGAFLTVQKAIDTVAGLDIQTFAVTIQIANGTYTGTVLVTGPWVGSGTVTVLGNTGTPTSVVLTTSTAATSQVKVQAGGNLTVRGVQLVASGGGAGAGCLVAISASSILFDSVDFGTCSRQMQASGGASITGTGSYSISGSATTHWFASAGGSIAVEGVTITLTGTPAYSGAFANISNVGVAFVDSNTFSGSATGTRYTVAGNGVLYTGGASTTYLPGNAAGSTSTGGQYN